MALMERSTATCAGAMEVRADSREPASRIMEMMAERMNGRWSCGERVQKDKGVLRRKRKLSEVEEQGGRGH